MQREMTTRPLRACEFCGRLYRRPIRPSSRETRLEPGTCCLACSDLVRARHTPDGRPPVRLFAPTVVGGYISDTGDV